MDRYPTIEFSDDFLMAFADRKFSTADRRAILKAIGLLDSDERHPSLRVHQLEGDMDGSWTCYASRSLRIVFTRRADGRKRA